MSPEPYPHTRVPRARSTLSQLVRMIVRQRWLVVCLTAACVLVAQAVVAFAPKTYIASTLIAPISLTPSSSSGAIGGLASVLEESVGLSGILQASDSRKSEIVGVLRSEALTEAFIRKENLLPVLFSDRWDPLKGTWKQDQRAPVPTLWEGNRYFNRYVRTVVAEPRSGLVTLTISWRDPKVAAAWANGLVRLANEYLRTRAIVESERHIAYLQAQAANTNVVAAEQTVYKLLHAEISNEMLTRGTDPYAFRIVDSAFVPEKSASPRVLDWTVAALVAGIMLSTLLGLERETRALPQGSSPASR